MSPEKRNIAAGKWVVSAMVISMLAIHFFVATTSALRKSLTHDEILHLVGACPSGPAMTTA